MLDKRRRAAEAVQVPGSECRIGNRYHTLSLSLLLDAKCATFTKHRRRNKLLCLFRDPNLVTSISILRFMFIPDAKFSLKGWNVFEGK